MIVATVQQRKRKYMEKNFKFILKTLEAESPTPSERSYAYDFTQKVGMKPLSPSKQEAAVNPDSLDHRLLKLVPASDVPAFKTAFYTIALLLLTGACAVGFWCVYHLLFAFLKPMLWAVLAGTVLFPVKQSVTRVCKGWLRNLRESGTPLIVGTVCLPISWLDSVSEYIWLVLTTSLVYYAIGGFLLIKVMMYDRLLVSAIELVSCVFFTLDSGLLLFQSSLVLPITVLYFCAFGGWLYMKQNADKRLARVLSLPVWLVLIVHIALLFGPYLRVVVFLAMVTALAALAAGVMHYDCEKHECPHEDERPHSPLPATETVKVESKGDLYLRAVAAACGLLFAATHVWVPFLLLIPIVYTVLKKTAVKLSLRDRFIALFKAEQVESSESSPDGAVPTTTKTKLHQLYDICVPHTIRGFMRMLFSGDQNIIISLESAVDLLSSVAVILLLVFCMVFGAVFIVVQLHSEAVHVMRVSTNVFAEMKSSGSVWSAASNFTSEHIADEDTIDDYVEQAYQQSRTFLATQVRLLAQGKDVARADELEAKVKELIDGLYERWTQRDEPDWIRTDNKVDMWTHLSNVNNPLALKDELMAIVTENLDTLKSVGQSVWAVISTNMSVITGLWVALLSILFDFGMELLNFLIELVVFFTMLYYLLALSGKEFKPMEMLNHLSISTERPSSTSSSQSISGAVQQSINGVFLLAGKMGAFYAMYTWFIHNLFGLNVVFVPTLLACVFAAVPLTTPCSVGLLGVLELWLVRGQSVAAVMFLVASVAPMAFADAAFYDEVKGSHPYLTGLAVVGGMYWLGLEGAVMGPIILCCVLALVNMYTSVF